MRFALRTLVLTLTIFLLFSVLAYGQDYSLPEIGIKNINISDEYFVATREECDSEMRRIVSRSGYSFSRWVSQFMTPYDIYLYGENEGDAVVTIKSEPFTELTFSMYSGIESKVIDEVTILTYDYEMITDSIKRNNALNVYRNNIEKTGIGRKEIQRVAWVDNGVYQCIPYILCSYEKDDMYIADFHTVFNGNKISITYTDSEPISSAKISEFSESITEIEYTHYPDYTEAKKILREKQEQEFAEKMEVYSAAKLVQYIFGFCIALMIMFAIYLDSRKLVSKKEYDFY